MKNRVYTQAEILTSKAYVKGIPYPAPTELLKGLLDIEKERFNISLSGTHEVINVNEDGSENISFGRLHLNYNFNIDNELRYDLGLVVALDKGKPIAKIYTGVKVLACMNLCIFGADQIHKFDISTTGLSYAEQFRNEFMRITANMEKAKKIMTALKSKFLKHSDILALNGYMLEQIIEHNQIAGTNPILHAIKLQCDKNTRYYAKEGLNAWVYLNSLTEYLDAKIHPLDIPEKALNLYYAVKPFIDEIQAEQITNQINLIDSIEEVQKEDPKQLPQKTDKKKVKR